MPPPKQHDQSDDRIAQLFQRYRAPLYAYFSKRARTASDAEDLTQEVFIRLSRLPEDTEIRNPEAFLFSTATNLMRDRIRRLRTRDAVEGYLPPDYDPETGEPDAVRVLEGKYELQGVILALGELSEKTRNIFVLRRVENMRCEEIAELYGISRKAVEQHITKAMAHLMRSIER